MFLKSILFSVFILINLNWVEVLHFETKSTINYKVYIDKLENIFVINSENELLKYSNKGEFISVYRNKSLGKLSYIDCTNPLQIMAFYSQSNNAVLLDNNLYETNRINLNSQSQGFKSTICRSFDNNFWIYNEREGKVKKIAIDQRTVVEGAWISNKLQMLPQANYMIESSTHLLINFPDTGIAVLDKFGGYKYLIPIKKLDQFIAEQNTVYYLKDSVWFAYNLQNWNIDTLSNESVINANFQYMSSTKAVVLRKNEVILYSKQ